MAEFPYTPHPAKLAPFLKKIQTVGVPNRNVTHKFIQSIGFTSSNDRHLKGVLQFLGFINPSGVPQPSWHAYRDEAMAPIELAKAIRQGYSSLFQVYDDAYRKEDEALRSFFRSNTSVGDRTVGYMLRTFKSLCELADFTQQACARPAAPTLELPKAAVPESAETWEAVKTVRLPTAENVMLTVNIQLTLPPDKDGVIYDKFFESLKKHLLS